MMMGLSREEMEEIEAIAKVPIETRRYIAKLEEELADYKKHFEPQMIQIRMQSDAVAHQEKTYKVRGQDDG